MITCYLKPTDYCNVGCTHCYLPEDVRANRFTMSEDTLRSSFSLLSDMQVKARHQGVLVLFHGGEPLTVPIDWYNRCFEMMDEMLPGAMTSMQTSLIPLRRDHLPMLQERFNHHVGSSIDFSQRQIKGSVENYHSLWMQKVDMAREAGILVIPGVVPTRRELGREQYIVDWMMDREFEAFNIDRYNSFATSFDDRPSNAEHSRFLSGLFDAVMNRVEKDGWAPVIGTVQGVLTGVMFGIGGDRWGGSCMNDFIVVGPDGALNNCPDKQTVEKPFSFAREGWEAFSSSRSRRRWVKHQMLGHKEDYCASCENQAWCGSGCPITPNGAPNGEDECSGYKKHITHVRQFLATSRGRELADRYLNLRIGNRAAEVASVYSAPKQKACVV
ncbi:hypothetical protein ACFOY8_13350 [Thalassospira xianhensis]|uniref:transcriptional regulator n=1 Tax=Thalassospira xianhensis TaxID=478503 RepID=UPI0011BF32AD|nr:transcriptional regulator [Thalassospira xianhensis]